MSKILKPINQTKPVKEFSDVYSESNNTARLNIGDKTNLGQLLISSKGHEDQHGNSQSVPTLSYSAETGTLIVGDSYASTPSGKIIVHQEGSRKGIVLNGDGSMQMGGTGDAAINMLNRTGKETILLDGKHGNITLGDQDGLIDGDIKIKNGKGDTSISLNGSEATAIFGGQNSNGKIDLKNEQNIKTIRMDGQHGNVTLGGGDADGDITIKNSQGNDTITLNGSAGDITVGGIGSNGDITVKNGNDVATIKIKGSSGDIEFLNADFAEDFDIAEEVIDTIEPGTVMTLNQEGKLVPCRREYDNKVVGVISGAGKYKPGIVMDKNGENNRLPIAIMGKVFCKVDARNAKIEIGDLITTSEVAGYAMKAVDKNQAFGSVIGKALQPLKNCTSLIPILINLQ